MNYDEFRDVDDLTYDEDAGREIEALVNKKAQGEKKAPKQPSKKQEETKPVVEEKQEPEKKEVKQTSAPKQASPQKEKVEPEQKKQVVKQAPQIKAPQTRLVPPKKEIKQITKPIQKISKKAKKSIKQKKKEEKPKKTQAKHTTDWILIVISAVVILAVIVGAYFIFNSATKSEKADTVAAIVNGDPIYNSDIDSRMQIIKVTENPFVTRDDILNASISQKLLEQEAAKEGYKVTEKEIETILKDSLEKNNLTLEGYKQDLEASGLEYNAVINYYKDNLLVYKYLNNTIIKKIFVIDEDIEKFYNDNIEQFKTPSKVQIRHILIGFSEENDTETLKEARDIEQKILPNKLNFCELVEKYTDDKGSAETCGEYNFSEQDPYVPEFVEAGFSMKPGEIEIVKTQFGYHIMYKVSNIPETVIPLSELKEGIKSEIEREQTIEKYEELLNKLRENAIIERYTNEGEILSDENTIATMIAEAPKKETVKTEEAEKQTLAKCLSSIGAKMYTVYWSPFNEEQLNMFGSEKNEITVIECDKDAENSNFSECESKGIRTYPSWIIKDKLYEGIQSPRGLAEISGCQSLD